MQIQGKVIIKGRIIVETGLHIGGASTGLEIGGVNKVVVRNPLDNQPYIPGSSLKGKLRALLERVGGFADNSKRVYVKRPEISMHLCNEPGCYLCTIFGRNNAKDFEPVRTNLPKFKIDQTTPTRLIVRDGKLDRTTLDKAQTDLPFTEVKWEVGIDRITSAANPRQIERVPAGAEFDFEMVYTVYTQQDRANLKRVFEAMQLLEHDYLGGQGSRGSGQVKFAKLNVDWYPRAYYETGNSTSVAANINQDLSSVKAVLEGFAGVQARISLVPPNANSAPAPAPVEVEAPPAEPSDAAAANPPQPE